MIKKFQCSQAASKAATSSIGGAELEEEIKKQVYSLRSKSEVSDFVSGF